MSEKLTPQQAADVIKYYHTGENAQARANGWKNKNVALGLSALHTIRAGSHSILPDASPVLTGEEMIAGQEYILNPPVHQDEGESISPARQRRIDALMDGSGVSLDEALRRTA